MAPEVGIVTGFRYAGVMGSVFPNPRRTSAGVGGLPVGLIYVLVLPFVMLLMTPTK